MTQPPLPADATSPRRLTRFLPLLGLVLFAWILSRLDGQATMAAFGRVSGSTVALAATFFMFNLLVKAVRWWRLLTAQQLGLPWSVALAAFLAAQFYGQVTLGRVGEFYRAEPLIERRVPTGKALSSCVVDRIFDLFMVLGLGAVLGALVVDRPEAAVAAVGFMLAGGLLLFVAVLMYRDPALLPGLRAVAVQSLARAERWSFAAKLVRVLRDMLLGTLGLLRWGTVLEASLWTAVAWVGYFGALISLAEGMGIDVPRTTMVAAASLAALSGLLPVTVSGLGARELIYQQILETHGIAPELAVVLALLHLGVMSGTAIGVSFFGAWARVRQRRLAME